MSAVVEAGADEENAIEEGVAVEASAGGTDDVAPGRAADDEKAIADANNDTAASGATAGGTDGVKTTAEGVVESVVAVG